jgi:hypothetical protein
VSVMEVENLRRRYRDQAAVEGDPRNRLRGAHRASAEERWREDPARPPHRLEFVWREVKIRDYLVRRSIEEVLRMTTRPGALPRR